MAKIRLRHKQYEGLSYGPNNEIQFGLRGGAGPFEALVDEDDPLVTALLAEDSNVEIVQPKGQADKIYVCPIDSGQFLTLAGFKVHQAAAHKKDKAPRPLFGAAKAAAEKAAKAAADEAVPTA